MAQDAECTAVPGNDTDRAAPLTSAGGRRLRIALLLACLFHDIGKGANGGVQHAAVGAPIARELVEQLGVSGEDADLVERLVREHLTLVELATRRDHTDPATVDALVAAVDGRAEVLRLLRLLTEADAKAAGPAAWTPWRAQLINDLTNTVDGLLVGEPLDLHGSEFVDLGLARSVELDGIPRIQLESKPGGSQLLIAAPIGSGCSAIQPACSFHTASPCDRPCCTPSKASRSTPGGSTRCRRRTSPISPSWSRSSNDCRRRQRDACLGTPARGQGPEPTDRPPAHRHRAERERHRRRAGGPHRRSVRSVVRTRSGTDDGRLVDPVGAHLHSRGAGDRHVLPHRAGRLHAAVGAGHRGHSCAQRRRRQRQPGAIGPGGRGPAKRPGAIAPALAAEPTQPEPTQPEPTSPNPAARS